MLLSIPSTASMHALAPDNLIFYKISEEIDGFKLRIWEKPPTWSQDSTYQYILNYQATSMVAAQELLTTYLARNGRGLAKIGRAHV